MKFYVVLQNPVFHFCCVIQTVLGETEEQAKVHEALSATQKWGISGTDDKKSDSVGDIS